MAVYAVGDIQGCYDELRTLLDTIRFDPDRDNIWFVGDLVNRGPKSLKTLRFVKSMGKSAICVLGNHDLHLLSLALVGSAPVNRGNLDHVLRASDRDELIDWLRRRPLAHYDRESEYADGARGGYSAMEYARGAGPCTRGGTCAAGQTPDKFSERNVRQKAQSLVDRPDRQ